MEAIESLGKFPSDDTIRVLITTDNHVGYNENDAIVGDDSWKTFHEVMTTAQDYNVDMVLQSGDLFHVNKPSKKSIYQVMKTLRMCCMGDRPCELEFLSDPAECFRFNDFPGVNYEDPNLNISIPVFSISGNHDDASGDGLLSPMDILQVSGLVNHFGKVTEADNIEITPLLFKKGVTKLALYGLASVRDERLFRTFKEGKVKFNIPDSRDDDDWFNLMCVHQNHTGHTNTAFLPETFLPNFLDLVVWGHEHECIPHLVHNPIKDFDVLQPGSSVATSLCDAEAKPKQIFILELKNNEKPSLIAIPLKTVRPFIMKDISLRDFPQLKPLDKSSISQFLYDQIDEMIQEAVQSNNEENEDENGTVLPLIRLRVNYSGDIDSQVDYQVENPRRFSNRFVGKVANANNVVQFYKKKSPSASKKKKLKYDSSDTSLISDQEVADLQVQTLVDDFLHKMQLSLLPELGLNEAVRQFVEKDDKTALKTFIDTEVSHEVDILAQNKELINTEDNSNLKQLLKEVKRTNTVTNTKKKSNRYSNVDDIMSDDDYNMENEFPSESRKTAPTGASQSKRSTNSGRKTRSTNRKRGFESELDRSESESEVDEGVDNIQILSEGEDEAKTSNSDDEIVAILDNPKSPTIPKARPTNTSVTSTKKMAKETSKQKSSTRSKGTRTPKSDALSELLARRRSKQ